VLSKFIIISAICAFGYLSIDKIMLLEDSLHGRLAGSARNSIHTMPDTSTLSLSVQDIRARLSLVKHTML
jgi:hypothetical protein